MKQNIMRNKSVYIIGDDSIYPDTISCFETYPSLLQTKGVFAYTNFVFNNSLSKVCTLKSENFIQEDFDLIIIDIGLFDAVTAHKGVFSHLLSYLKIHSDHPAIRLEALFHQLDKISSRRFTPNIDPKLFSACVNLIQKYCQERSTNYLWIEQNLQNLPPYAQSRLLDQNAALKNLEFYDKLIIESVGSQHHLIIPSEYNDEQARHEYIAQKASELLI